MSSLIISHDTRLLMLEVVVRNLYVPWIDVFDQVLMKKTIVKFRMLDDDWTTLLPNRRDYLPYRGSNHQNENFYGGGSVLFPVEEQLLLEKVSEIDVEFYVYKEVSRLFETDTRQYFGFTLVRVDDLLNGIIKDLRERKELKDHMSCALERAPIARSTCGVYPLANEDLEPGDATIELYIRISHFGECIITEIDSGPAANNAGNQRRDTKQSMKRDNKEDSGIVRTPFFAREGADPRHPYEFRELTIDKLHTGDWGSLTILTPKTRDRVRCVCGQPVQDAQTDARKAKGKKNGRRAARKAWAEEMARMQRLLAMLKAMRRGTGGASVGLAEKPKKVCPPPPCPYLCTVPDLSTYACMLACQPSPCLPTVSYCQPVPCNIIQF